ncbi:MAG: hypothetical protein JW891_11765 [Candidatus Lokiarchaeota archaeon]|nr:hypothetical protein [Candidatus Lokiarchaeota archaeon]
MYYWITLPVSILFVANAFIHLFYGVKLNSKYPREHNFYDTIVLFSLWIAAGIMYPLYFTADIPVLEMYLYLSTFSICIIAPLVLLLILYYQKGKIKKDRTIKERRNLSDFLTSYDHKNNNDHHSYKTDVTRKALHLFPAGMIIFLWVYSVYIWGNIWRQDLAWGISGEYYGRLLIFTIGYSGILAFAVLDYVRLSIHVYKKGIYHLLPDKVISLLGKTIKRQEVYEFTKPTAMVLTLAVLFIFPFPVFCAASLIATLGDAAASIVGKRFGKTKVSKKSKKTIIGCIAGFLASFGVCFLSFWIFGEGLTLIKICLMSLSGALIFLLVDALDPCIDDNMLNPIFCAIIMLIAYLCL